MTEHYYTERPTSRIQEHTFITNIIGNQLTFTVSTGIFSANHIDTGTRILIENAQIKENWKILDLGCGYGPVGIALAKANPYLQIVMSDINSRAVKLARENANQNKVETQQITSDGFTHLTEQFDTILLNPPQTAGKKVCEKLITESKEHLFQGGLLQIVARHNKGGAQLEKHMRSVFGNVKQIAKQSGFRVYVSKKE